MKKILLATVSLVSLTATGMSQTATSFIQPDTVHYEGIYGSPGYDGPSVWTHNNGANLINGSGLDGNYQHEDLYGGDPYDWDTQSGNYFNSYTWMVVNAKHIDGRDDDEGETAYLGFNSPVAVEKFYLWNSNSGGDDWGGILKDFELKLFDSSNNTLYSQVLTANPGNASPNAVDAQGFDLGGIIQGVSSMQFTPLSAHSGFDESGVTIGEIGFQSADVVPEPTSALLLAVGSMSLLLRRKRS